MGAVYRPTAAQVSALLLHLARVLAIPAVLTVTRRGGRLTRVAGAITVLGLINFSALPLGDYADLAARQVLDPATVDEVNARLGDLPALTYGWAPPAMVLTVLGLILVAVGKAVDRRPTIPTILQFIRWI